MSIVTVQRVRVFCTRLVLAVLVYPFEKRWGMQWFALLEGKDTTRAKRGPHAG